MTRDSYSAHPRARRSHKYLSGISSIDLCSNYLEKLNNLPKITQLVSGGAGFRTRAVTPETTL